MDAGKEPPHYFQVIDLLSRSFELTDKGLRARHRRFSRIRLDAPEGEAFDPLCSWREIFSSLSQRLISLLFRCTKRTRRDATYSLIRRQFQRVFESFHLESRGAPTVKEVP